MNTFLKKIKILLSLPSAGFIIVCLAIAARIIQLIYYFNLHVDLSYQVLATRNLARGHGISSGFVSLNDLSTVIYEPLINWPPGYSLLFLPFYLLFNGDYIIAGLTISLLSGVALIFITRSLLKLLDVPRYLVNLFTLVTTFYIYFFYYINSSDAIAICFFLLGLYFALRLLKTGNQITTNIIWMTMMMLACALLKYLFIPVVFIIPLYLALKGRGLRVPLTRAAVCSFLFLLVSIGLLLLYQRTAGGSAVYISEPGRGFYPESIWTAYPLFPASFLKMDTLELIFKPKVNFYLHAYQVIYLVFLCVATFYCIRSLRKKGLKTIRLTNDYFFLSYLLTVTIVLILGTLSFFVAPERGVWTYISDARYHGLPNLFLQLGLFLMLGAIATGWNNVYRKMIYLLFFLLLIEMGHGLYFTLNRIKKLNREEYSWQFEDRFQKYAASLIDKEKRIHPGTPMVLTGPVYFLNHRVSLYTGAYMIDEKEQDRGWDHYRTKRPVLLAAIVPDDEAHNFKAFISEHQNDLKGKFDQFSFYILYVQPGP